jgi:hypothetical protein
MYFSVHSNNCIAILDVIKCCYITVANLNIGQPSANDERSVVTEATEVVKSYLQLNNVYTRTLCSADKVLTLNLVFLSTFTAS